MYVFVLEWTPALTPVTTNTENMSDDGHRGVIPHGHIFSAFMVGKPCEGNEYLCRGRLCYGCVHGAFYVQETVFLSFFCEGNLAKVMITFVGFVSSTNMLMV